MQIKEIQKGTIQKSRQILKEQFPAPAVMVKPGKLEDIDAALELELVPQGHQVAECGCLLGNVCICITPSSAGFF